MKLSEFVKKKAVNAKIDSEKNEALKALLENPALNDIEIDDVLANTIFSAHLTKDAAKNHQEVLAHAKAMAFDGLDAQIAEHVNEYGLSEDVANSIKSEKNTYKKVQLFAKALKDLQKEAPKGSDDSEALKGKYNELKALLANKEKEFTKQLAEKDNEYVKKHTDLLLENNLSKFNFISEIPKEEAVLLSKTRLSQKLAEYGFVINNTNGKLELKGKDNTDAYIDNNKVELNDLLETAVNGLIKANEGNPKPQGNGLPNLASTSTINNPKIDSSVISAYDDAIKWATQ